MWTPHFMGFGNVLLLILWVDQKRQRGEPGWVLVTDALRPWLGVFPELLDLVVEREDVGIRDQRVMPWRADSQTQETFEEYGRGFDDDEIDAFVRRYLASAVAAGRPAPTNELVLNIRRGDYYSDPEIRGQYAFDLDMYLRTAVARAFEAGGPAARFHIVSDGPDWCRERLTWLNELAPVTYADPHDGPVEHFLRVARARRMIITNSTFSYWAAYVSNVINAHEPGQIVAPLFFDRSRNGGHSWLLDSRWSVVGDIPGGWDS